MSGSGSQRGFTLLELLAAMAVFAVMTAMAYGGLNALLQVRQEGMKRMESLAGLQTFFMHFSRDVEQVVPRSMTDGKGGVHGAFEGADGTEHFLEMTRGGRPNPRGVARSALQRVAYLFEDGKILRRAWSTLDRVGEELPKGETLLEDLTEVEIRFLGSDNKWHGVWPEASGIVAPGPAAGMGGRTTLPRAVEIVIVSKGWGRIRRLFEIPGGA
ncbi:MAG: type II secretion system minor pseudopilin GspJ [Magnetococcales bacterium]|nr:type II secretion system minor pseudopilin GspJ [Magnetococcales bacterium]